MIVLVPDSIINAAAGKRFIPYLPKLVPYGPTIYYSMYLGQCCCSLISIGTDNANKSLEYFSACRVLLMLFFASPSILTLFSASCCVWKTTSLPCSCCACAMRHIQESVDVVVVRYRRPVVCDLSCVIVGSYRRSRFVSTLKQVMEITSRSIALRKLVYKISNTNLQNTL
jgi:hypothetical protein